MSWDPNVYDQFKDERTAPFLDALAMIAPRPGLQVIDLGCGTGALTARLAGAFPDAEVLGIDTSAEMLAPAASERVANLRIEQRDIAAQLGLPHTFDLIFSNAALQWLPDHRALFPRLVRRLRPDGQLVVQMPAQHRNQANVVLYELASEDPFRSALTGHDRQLSMLDPEEYAEMLFRTGGRDIQVMEKIYPIVVPDAGGVYDFINGSALRPYLAALSADLRAAFSDAFLQRLHTEFPERPVFYPFKRILMSARF